MARFVRAAQLDQVEPGQCLGVELEGEAIVLSNIDGELYAVQDQCLHRNGPLSEGFIDGCAIVCPWHGWRFDVTTGACLTLPGPELRRYQVKVEDGEIKIAL